MEAARPQSRIRAELARGALEGLLAGGVVFAAWLVGLSLLTDEILDSRPALEWLIKPAFERGLALGGGVSLLIAVAFALVRRQFFAQMRVHPERMALFDKLTADLPVMLFQLRQWPTGFGSVTYCTEAVRAIYELSPEQARQNGNQILSLVHRDDYDRVFQALRHSHATLATWHEEYRVVLPRAGVRWRLGHARVERLPDGGTLWHGFVIDVTAEKQATLELAAAKESAEAANREKSRFLAMMSHDIRTPVGSLIGFASLLRDTPLDAEQREHVDTMEKCAEGLLTLVNDILDLSKIEAGHLRVNPRAFDLRACLEEITAVLRVRARHRGIRLDLDIPDSVPPVIETDRTRLAQVLTNLIGNAVKFTEFGGVKVAVDCTATGADPSATWTFTVTDTGPGIPEDQRHAVFSAFHQLDGVRCDEGTGLGLAISRQICRRLGGDVQLRSRVGVGSTFTATVAAPALGALPDAPAPVPIDPGAIAGRRVLLVEDNPVNAKLAILMLRRLGCTVDHAVNGRDALLACRRGTFDAVLMDIQLPVLDGHAATRELRELERRGELPGSRPLRIIALTANAMPEDRQAALDSGMNDYLSKPIREADLRRALANGHGA